MENSEAGPLKYSQLLFDKGARWAQWKEDSLLQMVLERLDIHKPKKDTQPKSQILYKYLRKPSGSRAWWQVLRLETKSTIHKEKTDKFDLTKMKSFCTNKYLVKRMKKATDWENTGKPYYLIKNSYL